MTPPNVEELRALYADVPRIAVPNRCRNVWDALPALLDELDRARKDLERAREAGLAALKAANFAAYTHSFGGQSICRFCDAYEGDPHFRECRFAAALAPPEAKEADEKEAAT